MKILTVDLAATLDLYTQDYRNTFDKYLEQKIINNFRGAVEIVTVLSFYLTSDILNVPKRNIIYRNLFSILNIQCKNKNSYLDMAFLEIEKKPLFVNIFNVNRFQAIGWIYIMYLNEKIIFNNFKNELAQLPETRLKQRIELSIATQDKEWRSFNRRLSKIDLDTRSVDQICSGVDQANYRLAEILRNYDASK